MANTQRTLTVKEKRDSEAALKNVKKRIAKAMKGVKGLPRVVGSKGPCYQAPARSGGGKPCDELYEVQGDTLGALIDLGGKPCGGGKPC
jgi:hypothetical protein